MISQKSCGDGIRRKGVSAGGKSRVIGQRGVEGACVSDLIIQLECEQEVFESISNKHSLGLQLLVPRICLRVVSNANILP